MSVPHESRNAKPRKDRESTSTPGEQAVDADSADEARRLVREAEPFLSLEAARDAGAATDEAMPEPAQPFRFEDLSRQAHRIPMSALAAGSIQLEILLGQTQLSDKELAILKPGALLTLNELANEPVEILADGQIIARGEVVTIGDRPAVRIVEVL